MIVAIITARSGSKSVPHKNIRELGGIPLLGWVTKALKNSKLIEKSILSTDSEKYFEIVKSFNNQIIFHKRTPELAEDVPSELVLLDVIEKFPEFFDQDSILALIQPTTPFIKGQDIDNCVRMLIKNPKMNTCVAVKQISEYPEWMITKKNNEEIIGICKNPFGESGVRQNLEKRWIPNGGIYVMKKSFLEETRKIIDRETLIYEMPKINSIDIDEENDFIMCEALVNLGKINQE